jgi:hypothetical protein
MSPIKTLEAQRRGRQIGEVRLGATVPTANGGTRPTKLDTFRFTTKSPTIARAVAASLCGEAREATLANGDPTNEVITSVTELHVMVPLAMQLFRNGTRCTPLAAFRGAVMARQSS